MKKEGMKRGTLKEEEKSSIETVNGFFPVVDFRV